MRSVQLLIENLRESGVIFEPVEGERLRLKAPSGVITPEIQAKLIEYKPEIIARLQGRPFLTKDGQLHIPLDCQPKFRWWQGGQSVIETLQELNAPPEVRQLYTDEPLSNGSFVAEA